MVFLQNSGLSGVKAEEEESTEEKQGQHGWKARSFSHLCTNYTLKKMKVQDEKVEEKVEEKKVVVKCFGDWYILYYS